MKPNPLLLALLAGELALVTAAPSPANAASPTALKVAIADAALVAQQGAKAEAIRDSLKHIRLPPGFKIELFAVVPQARHMAVSASNRTVFVGR